jgi:hypothetical protein
MRNSDRWMTPAVAAVLILTGGLLVLATIAAVAYLSARHIDPEPMFRLVGLAVTSISSLGAFVLQLLNRSTVTKVEANTGQLAGHTEALAGHTEALAGVVTEVADAMPRAAAYPPRPPYPDPYADTVIRGGHAAAPGGLGSEDRPR